MLLVLLLALLLPQAAPQEAPVASTIEAATVFQRGAQVTRTASARVPAGTSALTFTGLTPHLDPESREIIALRLIESVARGARLHLRDSAFAARFSASDRFSTAGTRRMYILPRYPCIPV